MPIVDSFQAWRKAARPLLQRKIHPDATTWEEPVGAQPLFNADEELLVSPILNPLPKISREFLNRAEVVAHHKREDKWQRLYALVWRLLYEEPSLLQNPVDAQVRVFGQMFKAVCRDRHKMKAFVRFKSLNEWGWSQDNELDRQVAAKQSQLLALLPLGAGTNADFHGIADDYFVAWFEPEHLILPLVAPFFVKRFTSMRWSILTPQGCAHWNGEMLAMTQGVSQPPLPSDVNESLWLNYYANIFNPARVKLKMMQSEMPKKYWKNLPEAALIKELTRTAAKQVDDMIEAAGEGDSGRLLNARAVLKAQQRLRQE